MKTVLITGASSGIGKEFAKKFASHNYNLILVSRRKKLLEELKKELVKEYDIEVNCFACDLTKNPKAVYDYCRKKKYQVDVLVNNAGFGDYGKFIDSDIDKAMNMIDLNDKALVSLTYYFIKDMKKNGYGHIINVGSVASFVPGPYMAVYYATKSFVLSFSLSLREELRKENIRVSTICPGPTNTNFWEVANANTSEAYNKSYARKASDVANTMYNMFENNRAYSIDGMPYKLLIGVARHLPLELCSKTIGYIQSKTKEKK